ncbi:hypothetical protein BDN72DRAFT_771355, partial [Pluteus cervinus]
TDFPTIFATIHQVKQKTGAEDSAPPSSIVPDTIITAIDGTLTSAGTSGSALLAALHSGFDPKIDTGSSLTLKKTKNNKSDKRRDIDGFSYEEVFSGSGVARSDRDGSIQGTAYLTYTVVPNSTYNVDACLNFCDSVNGCVFANLYYEINNDLPNSNLKCAVYADVHSAAEKTNVGGQQLLPLPAGTTFIQNSSGFSSTSLVDPAAPDGYEPVFGPSDGANNAPGYMGFALLDKYDVQACANLCSTRGPDPIGGGCKYFNIWRALVDGLPTTYTCSMYFDVADPSTANNFGQGSLEVTFSRGYQKASPPATATATATSALSTGSVLPLPSPPVSAVESASASVEASAEPSILV